MWFGYSALPSLENEFAYIDVQGRIGEGAIQVNNYASEIHLECLCQFCGYSHQLQLRWWLPQAKFIRTPQRALDDDEIELEVG